MSSIKYRKIGTLLVFLLLFLTTCSPSTAQPMIDPNAPPTEIASSTDIAKVTTAGTPDTSIEATAVITPTAFLPFINKPDEKFFGVYFDQYWNPETVAAIMPAADQGAGKKHTAVGWFIDLEDTAFQEPIPQLMANNLYCQLESLWNAGYISFINLGTIANAGQILNGERDSQIRYAAQVYKQWLDLGGGRRAMIAPLQEMNGEWTAYGRDSSPDEIKQAYRYILAVFASYGVTRDQVWWVFAPNGYHDPAQPQRAFENYYPGDDVVDIVGFSAYNYGYCPDTAPYWRWESFPEIFEPYVARMQAMAPTKPVIIAETASTAYVGVDENGVPYQDFDQKSTWLIENYTYFVERIGVIGMFYFSFSTFDGIACDLEINPNGVYLTAYKDGLSDFVYRYFNTADFDLLVHQFD